MMTATPAATALATSPDQRDDPVDAETQFGGNRRRDRGLASGSDGFDGDLKTRAIGANPGPGR